MRRRSTPRRAAAFAALAAALPGLAGLLPGRPTWPTFALGAPALFGAGARTAAERARRRALSQEDLEAVKAGAGEGDAEALYTYGVLLLQGDGVPQDEALAVQYLRQAADLGNVDAQYVSGAVLLRSGQQGDSQWGVHYLNLAAQQEEPRAMYELGMALLSGSGTARDDQKGASWISASAGKGLADAQFQMGTLLLGGVGVEKKPEWAIYWFTQAAEQGSVEAMYNLGLMHDTGEGCEVNKELAKGYLQRAANLGDEESAKALEKLFG